MSYSDAISLFNNVKLYASQSFSLAQKYIDDLHSYVVSTIEMTPPDITITPVGSIVVDPNLEIAKPTPPSSSDYPLAPSEPSTTDYSMPSTPTYTMPSAPTLTDIVIPEFIDATIEGVTTSLPALTFSTPAIDSIASGGDVAFDDLLIAARTKLLSNIQNGGTMLNSTVEADIWNRDRERSEQALQDAISKATFQWSKMGFSLPDGMLSDSISPIIKEYMNRDLDRTREIAIKQAELEQDGMIKSLGIAVQLETVIVGSQNEYAKRVLEASKQTADVTIEIFKQRVILYNTELEKFKSDVVAYKTRVEAELARAEAYKARMAGIQTIAAIDESRVKLYSAQIGAIEQQINVYKTEIQSVIAMYDAEKSKIERYKAQVDAYIASIDAVTKKYLAEVEGYKSYIQAWVASSDSQTKFSEVNLKAQMAQVEAEMKKWEIEMKLVQEETTLKLEALKSVAQTASNVAAGALSATHAAVSMTYADSESEVKTYSF